jgi:hypothetical protein
MGELVDFIKWKAKKEKEEVLALRQEVRDLVDSMGPIETGPIFIQETDEDWSRRMVSMMLRTLDGYRGWPIDSSDM